MSFDFHEFVELRDKFVKMDKEFDNFIYNFLLQEGLRALIQTKENTPVDTGYLRNMWQLGDSNYTIQSKAMKIGKNKGKLRVTEDRENVSWRDATVKGVVRKGDTLEITIYNPLDYASYVEYGHAQEPGRYVPAIGKKLKKAWVDGYYMATIAIKDVEEKLPARFEQQFRVWLNSLGLDTE